MEDLAQLFLDNIKLTKYSCRKWLAEYPHLREDIMSEARIGLWLACLNFKPERGYKFSTYAVRAIRNEVQKNVFRLLETKKRKFVTISYDKTNNHQEGRGIPHSETMIELRDYKAESSLDMTEVRDKLKEVVKNDVEWTLNKVCGLTAGEISKIMDIPVNSVYAHIRNTQNRLRKELKDVI